MLKKCKLYHAALFTIAKISEQARFPSRDEWIKRMWYMLSM